MTRPSLPKPVRTALLSTTLWRILPTPATLYFNRRLAHQPTLPPTLPPGEWSCRERRALLVSSEDRLRNLEAKGPGLATVSAVVVAAVLVAITAGWNNSTTPARIILMLAAGYAVLSLLMPLYLVGPLKRDTIHITELVAAAKANNAEEELAQSALAASTKNDLQNLRLSNLLDAARRELSYVLALLLLWVLLVPATGLLRHDRPQHPHQKAPHDLRQPARGAP